MLIYSMSWMEFVSRIDVPRERYLRLCRNWCFRTFVSLRVSEHYILSILWSQIYLSVKAMQRLSVRIARVITMGSIVLRNAIHAWTKDTAILGRMELVHVYVKPALIQQHGVPHVWLVIMERNAPSALNVIFRTVVVMMDWLEAEDVHVRSDLMLNRIACIVLTISMGQPVSRVSHVMSANAITVWMETGIVPVQKDFLRWHAAQNAWVTTTGAPVPHAARVTIMVDAIIQLWAMGLVFVMKDTSH